MRTVRITLEKLSPPNRASPSDIIGAFNPAKLAKSFASQMAHGVDAYLRFLLARRLAHIRHLYSFTYPGMES